MCLWLSIKKTRQFSCVWTWFPNLPFSLLSLLHSPKPLVDVPIGILLNQHWKPAQLVSLLYILPSVTVIGWINEPVGEPTPSSSAG